MKIALPLGLMLIIPLAAQERSATHHLLGANEPLTAASKNAPRDIGRAFTVQTLPNVDPESLYIERQYTDDHNGVTHIRYRQRYQGIDVENASWVVNVDADGRVVNAGGTLYPTPQSGAPSIANVSRSAHAALSAVNPRLAARTQGLFSTSAASATPRGMRLTVPNLASDIDGRMIWWGSRGQLYAAWVFFITDEDGVTNYAAVVDDATGLPLYKHVLTYFQSAKGQVFERESPYPNPKPGTMLTAAPPLADRTVQSFTGDSTASPKGWVTGSQTVGNNAIVGENPMGSSFLLTPTITTATGGNFSFPLSLGAGALPTTQYTDAVNTNLFYWVNRAHDLHYQSGFTEAAGNFQTDNFGKGGVGGDALYAYTHYGAQATSRPALMNAFFTEKALADGSQPMIAMYVGYSGPGGFYTDGALDSNVVVHEYTHGVSERLLPNGYDTFQVAAMGEAWSDFFGLEYTLPDNADPNGIYPVGEYFFWLWSQGIRTRPYSTDTTINPLTFANLGEVFTYPEVHSDGEIWMEAMWDLRANLIQQFGDKEGRRRARILILDGMKLMPPQSSMVDARDAILLADRTDFKGASQTQLWAAFAKRGLGATAFAANPDSVHVHASFDVPSPLGKLEFYDAQFTLGEPLLLILSDSNLTTTSARAQVVTNSGDLEDVLLQKYGSVYVGAIATSANIVINQNGTVNAIPGDYATAFYTDGDNGSGKIEQVNASLPASPTYFASGTAAGFDTTGSETLYYSGDRIKLPFSFRFYDKTYGSLYAWDTGLISFIDTQVFSCTDTAALRAIPGIAPFWMQLTTQGGAQSREGIYYRQLSPTSVRIRWAGETVTPFASGSPVNFAAVLNADGSIQFSYGSGNTNLSQAPTYAGCTGSSTAYTPTIGISPGHDTYAQGTYIFSSLTNSTGIRFDPPFLQSSDPKIVVEAPTAGVHVQDVMTVSGVAYDEVTSFSRVYVLLDGVQFGSTTAAIARADYCGQNPVRGCPNIGFSMNINTSALSAGSHTLQVRGINARGSYVTLPATPIAFVVDAGQGRLPFGKVESPAAGDVVKGRLTVKGYAAINGLRIAGVDTLIDGVTYGPTVYGYSRADICGTLSPVPANCPGIGFQYSFDTVSGVPPLQDGDHTLQIRVRDETGRFTILPDSTTKFTVKNSGAYQAPVGAITSVKNGDTLSGSVDIKGWAYAPGSSLLGVYVYVDDLGVTAKTGQPAADVCANLPDVTACPNIGWTAKFDTTGLPNGPHVLFVYVYNIKQDYTVLPAPGQPTISVNIKN